ncbi:MAG: 30S ribosomal protein S8 [Desulfobacterales bacterium]|jgi:small subunit ribosomal protein S8|nr:30S ribosomal protein S8 [Desulfobacterales bacterium]
MTLSDPIADMLNRVRNAGKAKFNSLDIPGSKIKTEIAKVLKREGYIRNYKFVKDNKQGILRIYLKYDRNQKSAIYFLKRVSKPSRRVYVKSEDVEPIFNGTGISIISTSRGIMTDKEAREAKVGGEILCNIW